MLRSRYLVASGLVAATLLLSGPMVSAEKKAKKAQAAQTTPPPEDSAPAPTPSDAPAPPVDSTPPGPSEPPPDPALISPSKSIVENAANAPDHTTLVKAVKSAGLVPALSGAGPFTVFAPSNAGFERLPPGTVDALLKPENQGSLSKILNYHVIAGKITAADLSKKIKAGKGKATLTGLSGDTLTATEEGGAIKLIDGNGNASQVTKADVMGSNGIIHSINGVLIPTQKKADTPAR